MEYDKFIIDWSNLKRCMIVSSQEILLMRILKHLCDFSLIQRLFAIFHFCEHYFLYVFSSFNPWNGIISFDLGTLVKGKKFDRSTHHNIKFGDYCIGEIVEQPSDLRLNGLLLWWRKGDGGVYCLPVTWILVLLWT